MPLLSFWTQPVLGVPTLTLAVSALSCFIGGSLYLFGATSGAFKLRFAWSETQLGIIVGALFLGGTSLPPLLRAMDACHAAGRWRLGRPSDAAYLLLSPAALCIIAFAARQGVTTVVPYPVMVACFGLFGAGVIGTFTTVAHVITAHAGGHGAIIMTALQVMYAVGNVVFPLVYHGAFGEDLTNTFYMLAAAFALVVTSIIVVLRDPEQVPKNDELEDDLVGGTPHDTRRFNCSRLSWTLVLILAFAPLFGTNITTLGQFAPMLQTTGDTGASALSPWVAISIFGCGQLLGRLLAFAWSFTPMHIVYLTCIACLLQCIAHALPTIVFSTGSVLATLLLSSICYGLSWTTFTSACIKEHAQECAQLDFGTYLAVLQTLVAGISPVVFSVLAGVVYDTTAGGTDATCAGPACFRTYFVSSVVACAVGTVAAAIYAFKRQQSASNIPQDTDAESTTLLGSISA